MTSYPKIAVIGSGYWGKNLVRNHRALGSLKLICDTNESLLCSYQEQHPDVERALAFHDVCRREDIQGVVLATPAETHFTLAREALLAGKHVYVEKPLALDLGDGRELIELAKSRGLVLMVGHLLQYHPVFVKLRELTTSGELGRINYIYSHRLNLGKIRREENILWSFAPHDVSMILSLAGEDPEDIQATGGYYLHKKIADVTTTHLDFPSGLKAHIFVSWLHPFKEQKLVVVGDKKMAVFDDMKDWANKLLLYPHRINWTNNIPVPTKAEPERVDIHQAEPLRIECLHFLKCMSDGESPRTDGKEGLRVLKVLKVAQESLDNGSGTHSCYRGSSAYLNSLYQLSQPPIAYRPLSNSYIHPTAVIDDPVEIGSGTKIWHFSHILSGSTIGENCNIGQNVVIGPEVTIGSACKIQNNVSIYKGVTLEDCVFCGPSIVFTNIYNPRAELSKMDQVRSTLVKHGATLGANCTIVCGVIIGRYGFVGAGAVITRNVPDYGLMVGNPARRVGWVCECGERLTDNLKCADCGKRYENGEKGLKRKIEL